MEGRRDKLSASASYDDEFTTNTLWEWQEQRNPMLKHGSVVRPTMYFGKLGHQEGVR